MYLTLVGFTFLAFLYSLILIINQTELHAILMNDDMCHSEELLSMDKRTTLFSCRLSEWFCLGAELFFFVLI